MGSEPIRFGTIGCGRIADSHLTALAAVPGAVLTAVAEVRASAGAAVAECYACRHFERLDDPELIGLVDAVIIATPPVSHFEIARHFLRAGVSVLCEKPLTLLADQAAELVDTAADRRLTLMMASKFRYVDDLIKAKVILESGALGRVVLYENSFCAPVSMAERWNADPRVSGGGVLIDNGSHSVDIARYLLGPIRAVSAQPGARIQPLEVEAAGRALMGVARRDITPLTGIYARMWGAAKHDCAEGVHRPICLTALAFRDDPDNQPALYWPRSTRAVSATS